MAMQNAAVPHPGAPGFRCNDTTGWIDPILQHDELFSIREFTKFPLFPVPFPG
jgi:hypothetical protein